MHAAKMQHGLAIALTATTAGRPYLERAERQTARQIQGIGGLQRCEIVSQ
jgi:hypothetical protein